jgi:hypothetical protein
MFWVGLAAAAVYAAAWYWVRGDIRRQFVVEIEAARVAKGPP